MKRLIKRLISNKFLFIVFIFLISCKSNNFYKYQKENTLDTLFRLKYKAKIVSEGSVNNIKGVIEFNDKKQFFYINGVSENLGIEVFRLLINNDSIQFINRIQKNYYKDTIHPYFINVVNTILLGKYINSEKFHFFNDSIILNNDSSIKEYFLEYQNNNCLIHCFYKNWFRNKDFLKEVSFQVLCNRSQINIDLNYFFYENIPILDHKINIPKNYAQIKNFGF